MSNLNTRGRKSFLLLFIMLNMFQYGNVQAQMHGQELIDSLQTALKKYDANKLELKRLQYDKGDTLKANMLYDLGWELMSTGENARAAQYADEILVLSRKIDFKKGITNAYNLMGLIYINQGNFSEALKINFVALKAAQENGDKMAAANAYGSIGSIYDYQGNYADALKFHFTSLKIFEEIGNKRGIAIAYNNLSNIYIFRGDYQKALANNLAALKIREEIGDKSGIAGSYNNIGTAYLYMGKYADALTNYTTSLKLFEKLGDKLEIAGLYSNIGNVYYLQDNYKEALKNQLAALQIQKEIGDEFGIASTYINIGGINIGLKEYSEAKKYLNNALFMSKKTGARNYISESYRGLAELDSAMDNWKDACLHYKLHILYRDSLVNEENIQKEVQSKMNYDFSKKQDSLNLVQAKKDIAAQKELDKQKLIRNGFIGGAIIFLMLAGAAVTFFVDRMQRNRKKQMEAVRERISRDLHDDMGSTLQSISVMSELARMKTRSGKMQESAPVLEKIGNASREMIEKMNDIVWAVNPRNDQFENIIFHMRAFAGELLAPKDIILHFKADNDLNNVKLSMEKRKSFFLLFKEAINNAFKYSCAKHVHVEITKLDRELILTVEDDGVGFNMNEDRLTTGGNGLKNMKTRADELNGNITIASEKGKGTRVSLIVNLG